MLQWRIACRLYEKRGQTQFKRAVDQHPNWYPVLSHASLMTGFFSRYLSTTGFGTPFKGQEKFTHFEHVMHCRVQKNIIVTPGSGTLPTSGYSTSISISRALTWASVTTSVSVSTLPQNSSKTAPFIDSKTPEFALQVCPRIRFTSL